MALLLLMAFASSSCGKIIPDSKYSEEKRQYSTTDSTFEEFIFNFEQEASARLNIADYKIGDIPINFGETSDDKYKGICVTYANGEKEIIVAKKWWDSASYTKKEIFIFHELGHCALGRDHNDELVKVGDSEFQKLSLMNSFLPSSFDYLDYREEFLIELFTENKAPMISAISGASEHRGDGQ